MPTESQTHDHKEKETNTRRQQPPEQTVLGQEGAVQTAIDPSIALQRAMAAPPPAIKPEDILSLQGAVGNSAVQAILSERTSNQPVLNSTQPDIINSIEGVHKEEANQVAAMPEQAVSSPDTIQLSSTGIASATAIKDFTKATKEFVDKHWKGKSAQERANNLTALVNAELKKAGVPPCKIKLSNLGSGNAQFNFTTWELELNQGDFSRNAPSKAQMAETLDSIYHESRHAEQWFRMARLRAAEGDSANTIKTKLFIPARIAQAAAKNPLSKLGKTAGLRARWERNKEIKEAKAWYESVYGKGAADRNKIIKRLNTHDPYYAGMSAKKFQQAYNQNYKKYRKLKEEVDAWAVGGRVSKAYKRLK